MDRRRFLLASFVGTFATPLPVEAQPAKTVPVVGILHDWRAIIASRFRRTVVPRGRLVMLEQFTDGARRVVVLATEAARRRRHRAIEPEHLLLAILRDGRVLRTLAGRRFRAELARLETDVAGALDELPETPAETKPVFSNELRAALEAAFQVRRRPDVAVGVDHLLYGLLTHGVSTAGLILRSAGDQLELALRLGFFGEDRERLRDEHVRLIATSRWRVAPPEP